jgi:hypothetical protein
MKLRQPYPVLDALIPAHPLGSIEVHCLHADTIRGCLMRLLSARGAPTGGIFARERIYASFLLQ